MAFSRLLLCLASFIACAVAAPRVVPDGWSIHRRADPDATLPLKFTLAQSNIHNLDAYLLDVADPKSPNYGKHWTPAKVADTFRPSKETVDTVHSWLVNDAGIDVQKIRLSKNGDALHLDLTVAEAEDLLGAEYFVYRHSDDGMTHVGCHQGYTLPEHVSKHVDFVWPTTYLGSTSFVRRDAEVSSVPGFGRVSGAPKIPVDDVSALAAEGCDTSVTLDCLRGLYKYDYTPVSGDNNSVAVAEFSIEVYRPADLDMFFNTYAPDQVGHIPETISIAGGDPTAGGDLGESTLDIELVMGLLGSKQNLSLYQIGDAASTSVFLDPLLGAVDGSYCEAEGVSSQNLTDCGNKPTVNVVSISYHFNPDVTDPTISPIVQRECTEIGKLSLTGMTFIASSGDGGVGYSQSGFCQLANGTLQAGNPKGAFLGQLPASCPYVTAVGATSVATNKTVDDPEIATTRFASGGGFSNNFPRPSWQDDAVTNYLTNFGPNYADNIFNRSGRAYPDVAANGWPLVIAESGQFVKSGGTSASAPIFAAVITAVNDARIAAGKSPVGWINPALYSSDFAKAYNDVTNGTNPGCSTQGFNAAPGWDPVTGLGTPNFPELLAAFLALP
ncbi:subtilisin-like protein [Lentinus tigrinus ALCF2SS1-7]|uniref:Subtilisin-like protein n=1 Tax=Lentinus tigrinus ALCF2SS1-6 TaxID=1328759 RepID=A0A5C2S8D6_9APHY|nr:subtilisin-like protein [Lentinus tigrinus ALCF2SS1-6]RPD74857.1 subtilisin-like protein [Lentinus tigrinus ALCF2SS1-7]